MTDYRPISTPEERDALPYGTVAHWTIEDHLGVYDHLPAKYRPYMPAVLELHRVRSGWVSDSEPFWALTEEDLPPLPWRLVSQQAIDKENETR